VASVDFQMADVLLGLRDALRNGSYHPGPYRHFYIHDPKWRKISAAPFRDRVVQHALCQVIEPQLERSFMFDSYANRVGKGTHRAIDRFQQFARRFSFVLRLDVVQHFASIDHEILLTILARTIQDERVLWLIRTIVASGEGVLDEDYAMVWFPGDTLLDRVRPRGLPIGNLTSQCWSNSYLNPLDHFIKRELRCRGYVRYVDDLALFSHDKRALWEWKAAIEERLATLRLVIHPRAQVAPTRQGIPWLGFIVFPESRQVKARKVRTIGRRLRERWQAYCDGHITYAEFDATVQGWINHVRYADTWGLRRRMLSRPFERPSR
jgi:RNA-directed DNA polymerase